jgi:hypothetical protein
LPEATLVALLPELVATPLAFTMVTEEEIVVTIPVVLTLPAGPPVPQVP